MAIAIAALREHQQAPRSNSPAGSASRAVHRRQGRAASDPIPHNDSSLGGDPTRTRASRHRAFVRREYSRLPSRHGRPHAARLLGGCVADMRERRAIAGGPETDRRAPRTRRPLCHLRSRAQLQRGRAAGLPGSNDDDADHMAFPDIAYCTDGTRTVMPSISDVIRTWQLKRLSAVRSEAAKSSISLSCSPISPI